jgi:queuine tRNA-ribosyltransferase
MVRFEKIATDGGSSARAGVFHTAHGSIETPIFMPVGTVGTVKGIHQHELHDPIKAQIILGNTYHLYLRPGTEILSQAGGLHRFMGWDKPILTDSGGYQIFSLAQRRKLSEEGAVFSSHIDGSKHHFSPEKVMEIQRIIGADIVMAFDECPPYPAERRYIEDSMHLTHRWLKRCFEAMENTEPHYGYTQCLFPIVQGGIFPDLREASANYCAEFGRGGIAIGGLSVGEPEAHMYAMTEKVCSILPTNQARYLMGVGTPVNLLENIALGVDLFDCVMPTRNARNGMLFTREGIIHIKNKKWANVFDPIPGSENTILGSNYTLAYLRHLFVSGERLAGQIASLHNLRFYLWLVEEARKQILAGNFSKWKAEMQIKVAQKL